MLEQAHTPLKSGLASFVQASPDYELAPVGLGAFQEQADRLAEFGRNGDIYVVHAAEGETVVPMEVLEANPQVKELLFGQMRDMGLDPKEYTVGDELNSINPYTGMPEFFLKKIFKGVKKVIMKAAPIVVPMIAGTFFGPLGAMLASAAITKLQGGSWGDVLKGAAMSYIGGSLMEGIGGALTGTSIGDALGYTTGPGGFAGFTSGLERGLAAPFTASSLQKLNPSNWGSRAAQLGSQVSAAGSQLVEDPMGAFDPVATSFLEDPGSIPGAAGTGAGTAARDAVGRPLPQVDFGPQAQALVGQPPFGPPAQALLGQPSISPQAQDLGRIMGQPPPLEAAAIPSAATPYKGIPGADFDWTGVPPSPSEDPSIWDRLQSGAEDASDVLFGRDPSEVDIAKKAREFRAAYRAEGLTLPTSDAIARAREELAVDPIRRYGPSLALAGGAAYLGGAFEDEEQKPSEAEKRFAAARRQRERERAEIKERLGKGEFTPDVTRRPSSFDPPVFYDYKYYQPRAFAAEGGLMDDSYPRRDLLVEGPGTERSDDIPAMLSDGEFVMNARSVRGADPTGRGDRYRGAQNLYGLMRDFEMRG